MTAGESGSWGARTEHSHRRVAFAAAAAALGAAVFFAAALATACVGDTVSGTGLPPADTDGGAAAQDGGAAAAVLAISDIRNPMSPKRPTTGASVQIAGAVVTNVKAVGNTKLFFVQDPTAVSYAGITIVTGVNAPTVAKGAIVTVTGTFTNYKGLEEITATDYSQTGTGALPDPVQTTIAEIMTGGSRGAELQSMLVQVKNVTATAATSSVLFPIVDITSPGPTMEVTSFYATDTMTSPFPAASGDKFSSITGNLIAATSTALYNAIAPGGAADVVKQ